MKGLSLYSSLIAPQLNKLCISSMSLDILGAMVQPVEVVGAPEA